MLHAQIEGRVALRFAGKKIQEIPLGHQGDEFTGAGEAGEIDGLEGVVSEDAPDGGEALVGEFEEFIEEAQFVHDLQGGGMNGVAPEIAEEVAMFFEDGDGDFRASQEVAEHDARGSAAYYAAGGFNCLCGHTRFELFEGKDVSLS
jgi:hypothetical protein